MTPAVPKYVIDAIQNGEPMQAPREVMEQTNSEITLVERPVVAGYEELAAVLQSALDQAQTGKGKERHANNRPIDRQPIMEIARMVGLGYPTGQAQKKTQEAVGMFNRGEPGRAVAELKGAIIYLAAAIMLIREQ